MTISSRRLLFILIAMAIILRLGSAFAQGNQIAPLPGVYDQLSYHPLALRVLDGYGFSFATDAWPATRAGEPTAHWSFLYTLYLAGVYALFGPNPLAARLIQAVLVGVLHTWLVWRIGRRLFGDAAGLVAAGLSAVYLYFVYYAGALMTEPFYFVGILWVLDATLRLAQPGRRWWAWLELGLAVGVTGLLRQSFLLFVPFLFLWIFVEGTEEQKGFENPEDAESCAGDGPQQARQPETSRSVPGTLQQSHAGGNGGWLRRRLPALGGLVLTTLVVVAMIAPWTVRNHRVFGTFTPLNTNAGYAFFWGNHPIYGTRFVGILPADGPSYQELIPDELRPLNEAELDKALLKRGIGFVTDDPMRYALLSISRTREYFKFWPSPQSSLVSNVARVASFGLMLPFMLYGLYVSFRYRWPVANHTTRAGIILLLLFAGVYSAIHLLTWALIRYRPPVDAILLIFAAVGIVQIPAVRHFHTISAFAQQDTDFPS